MSGSDRMTMKETANVDELPRLLVAMREEIGPKLQSEFGYSSVMEIPTLSKVIINMGLGEALQNNRAIESATNDLMTITGQKPVTTKAKKSIAGFKIREGMPIGVKVTLRGKRMYEFVDRLLNAALPRADLDIVPKPISVLKYLPLAYSSKPY